MSRKRTQANDEPQFTSKRTRLSNKEAVASPGIIDHNLYYAPVEQKKKIETSWKKSMKTQGKDSNLRSEIDQIKKETHPLLVAQLEKLKRGKELKFRVLEEWRENQFRIIEESMELGRRECEEDYEKNLKEIKDQLLGLANHDKKKREQETRSRSGMRKSRGNSILRGKSVLHVDDEATSIVAKIQALSRLPETELESDLALIRQAIKDHQARGAPRTNHNGHLASRHTIDLSMDLDES